MHYTVGVIMDPIAAIKPHKDTSFAMMLEAQRRGATVLYFELKDLYLDNGKPMGRGKRVTVIDRAEDFYAIEDEQTLCLGDVDVLLMRKDPPFDGEFLYATQILSLAQDAGALVVNNPQALRDYNEKLFTSYFPEHIPHTLVTNNPTLVREFHATHKDIICKPLDGMGGASIFRVKPDGNNLGVIIETLTQLGQRYMMVQEYLPEIKDGDKRVLIVDGEVIPYCLARLPTKGETRGNLAAGGTGRPQPISASDRALANAISPTLKANNIMFVGLDVIGNKITEINITSPTCVREIEGHYNINIMAMLFDAIEKRLASN
ncbi:MAG TPA: glutathione synthase [Alteromonas australica]|jgi:glutathione synthase|uniref:Glutathione synthetase n=1 Tax=Alteromonas australica TaxID=589873 RepID=A0A075P262_9ALTE|nr:MULTISPECIES: glutathione synthase [Alteromonas]MAF69373.1 glutathione synthase [Alteromonas sp.]AIF99818.1 glutathione synthetase [Alteromonas australica]AJP44788.1 glutathione synthetase [Alteromonas australica]MAO31365.1 glutathione synthase [Alteromonas sp.]MBU34305.1 glutathione synthase [Alteromonas sp.]|tara:strand:+ start:6148 stop:7101 length:954 start_codon:yes stop_codon:yes gene_type:complete